LYLLFTVFCNSNLRQFRPSSGQSLNAHNCRVFRKKDGGRRQPERKTSVYTEPSEVFQGDVLLCGPSLFIREVANHVGIAALHQSRVQFHFHCKRAFRRNFADSANERRTGVWDESCCGPLLFRAGCCSASRIALLSDRAALISLGDTSAANQSPATNAGCPAKS